MFDWLLCLRLATVAALMNSLSCASFLAVLLISLACSSSPPDGRTLYERPLSRGNTFACATCHALGEPAGDGLRRPGHPIGDASARPSYKNGQHTSLLAAVNTCVTEWMAATAFAENDKEWIALRGFLQSQAPAGAAPALAINISPPPTDLSGGSAAAGREVFHKTCVVCHGTDATGTERAPLLRASSLDAAYIAERVRLSGSEQSPTYPGLTGGRMPFWATDRLSDAELIDVVAYVLSNEPPTVDAAPRPDAGLVADAATACAQTHPSVGQTAQLVTRYHGVMGLARIVDDCTVRIEQFSYDGTGVDVRVYGGLGGDFVAGFAMSDDLILPGGYQNDTLTATLPSGKTLSDLDSISIWCVDVSISFGDGAFQ